jgi:signal transduction histidine kinase
MTSMRARLTVIVVGVVASVLIALGILLYFGVHRAAWQQYDDGLIARAVATATIAEHEDGDYEMALPPAPRTAAATYVEVWRPDGSVVAKSESLGAAELPRGDARLGHPVLADLVLLDGRQGRAVTLQFVPREDDPTHPSSAPLVLVLAEGTEHVTAAVATVQMWFVILGIGSLVAIALATTWSLRRGLRPLAKLATEIGKIDDRHLAIRLPVDGQPSELEVPVKTLNGLLERLDASFARERQFTADVGHELRTPLAGLRTLLEVTALAERSTTEYQTAVADALAIVLQLGAVVDNLMMLARLDAGQVAVSPSEVALRALVDECWKPHAALAATRSLEFRNTVPPDAVATTDREKLRVVIANLLANAVEYTATGGWIEVATNDDAVLDVTDSGPPIPADQLDRIFDRLWRGDTARSATGVHCGIGLALSRSLCASLTYELTAASSDEQVRFRIGRA